MHLKHFDNHWWIHFDHHVDVEVLTDGKQYNGLGRVKCDSVHLRSGRLPVLPLILTNDGYRVCNYKIRTVKEDGRNETITFFLTPVIVNSYTTGRRDRSGRCVLNTCRWPAASEVDRGGELKVELRPYHALVAGIEMRGFTYSYRFKSRKHPPASIHDRSSWEIGGRSTRNILIQGRNIAEPYKMIQNKQEYFSTAVYESKTPLAQFRPAFSELQPFSYQIQNNGVLITMPSGPEPFCLLMEKQAASDEIICWRQFINDRARGGTLQQSPSIQVMYGEFPMRSRCEQINRYSMIQRELTESIFPVAIKPAVLHGPAGEICLSDQIRERDVEKGIRVLADASCSHVMISPQYAGDRHLAGDDIKAQGRLENIIAGAASLARRNGMETAVLWRLQQFGDAGKKAAPHGKDLMLFFERLYARHGIAGIYLAGELQHDAMQTRAKEPFWNALNRKTASDICQFLHQPSPVIQPSDVPSFMHGNEFFYQNSSIPFPYSEPCDAAVRPGELFFRGCAHKIYYRATFKKQKNNKYGINRCWNEQFTSINRAFRAVQENMAYPRLLPGDNGIIWESHPEDGSVLQTLWSFDRFDLRVGPDARVYNVMDAEKASVEAGMLSVNPFSVYLIEDDAG